MAKIVIHPTPITEFSDVLARATIFNMIPGIVVLAAGAIFNTSLILIAAITFKKRDVEVQISSIREASSVERGSRGLD